MILEHECEMGRWLKVHSSKYSSISASFMACGMEHSNGKGFRGLLIGESLLLQSCSAIGRIGSVEVETSSP